MGLLNSSNNYNAFGLDIGFHSIKIVQLEKKRGLIRLASFNNTDVPSESFVNNTLKNTDEIAKTLKEAMKGAKIAPITSKYVIVGIPEHLTFTKIASVPKMGQKELKDAVKWEVTQSIPVSIEELDYDFEIMSENEKNLQVLIVAAPKNLIKSYLEVAEKAGLQPVAVEVEPQAVSRALVKKDDMGTYLIIDIGAETTSVTVLQNQIIQFTASATVGGHQINKAIALKLGKPVYELDKILHHSDNAKNKEILTKAFNAAKPTLQSINQEVIKTIRYYEEESKSNFQKILLCGGESILPGMTSFFETSTNITTKIGNPWVNLPPFPLKPIPHEILPSYATAIGLALREFI